MQDQAATVCQSQRRSNWPKWNPLIGLCLLMVLWLQTATADDVLTEFTLDSSNASVELMSVNQPSLSIGRFSNIFDGTVDFEVGTNDYNYVTQVFTPPVSGTYTFGQTEAPVDTVMLVYEGDFEPAQPGDRLVSFNDDYGSQISAVSSFDPDTVDDLPVTIVSCSSSSTPLPQRCPIVEMALTEGQSYEIVISTFSSSASVSLPQQFFVYGPGGVFVGQVPGAPTDVAAMPGNGEALVSWTAPTDEGGSAVTGYTVTASPGGQTCSTTGTTSCTVTGLTNGTAYTFTVAATNAEGDGPASDASAPVTPATVPTAPTSVTASAGNAEAAVSWTAPADDGGSAISGYTVTSSPGGQTCSTTGTTSCTVTGLTNGTAYTFTVVATNAEGDSPASDASAAVTPAGPPGEPQNIQVQEGVESLTVSWTAPNDNGGSPITAYVASVNPSCSVTAVSNEVPGETDYSCTISGLSASQSYTVSVTASNAVGDTSADALDGSGGAGSFTPLSATTVPIPVNNSWALLVLILLTMSMGGLVLRKSSA